MGTISAYYQCHKNPASFIRCVKSFLSAYPGSKMVVTNDGGHDYAKFCENNGIRYTYTAKTDTLNDALIFAHPTCMLFLENLWKSLPCMDSTHVLLLEDDVRVVRKHTAEFNYTINGCNRNAILRNWAVWLLKEKGVNGPYFYGACGGCVIDRQFLQNIPFDQIVALMDRVKAMNITFASDEVLSFIVLYFGGSIGQYDEFAEMWYKDIGNRLQKNTVAFLHQFKKDYEKNGVFPTEAESAELYPPATCGETV